jgi:hypothetical protein
MSLKPVFSLGIRGSQSHQSSGDQKKTVKTGHLGIDIDNITPHQLKNIVDILDLHTEKGVLACLQQICKTTFKKSAQQTSNVDLLNTLKEEIKQQLDDGKESLSNDSIVAIQNMYIILKLIRKTETKDRNLLFLTKFKRDRRISYTDNTYRASREGKYKNETAWSSYLKDILAYVQTKGGVASPLTQLGQPAPNSNDTEKQLLQWAAAVKGISTEKLSSDLRQSIKAIVSPRTASSEFSRQRSSSGSDEQVNSAMSSSKGSEARPLDTAVSVTSSASPIVLFDKKVDLAKLSSGTKSAFAYFNVRLEDNYFIEGDLAVYQDPASSAIGKRGKEISASGLSGIIYKTLQFVKKNLEIPDISVTESKFNDCNFDGRYVLHTHSPNFSKEAIDLNKITNSYLSALNAYQEKFNSRDDKPRLHLCCISGSIYAGKLANPDYSPSPSMMEGGHIEPSVSVACLATAIATFKDQNSEYTLPNIDLFFWRGQGKPFEDEVGVVRETINTAKAEAEAKAKAEAEAKAKAEAEAKAKAKEEAKAKAEAEAKAKAEAEAKAKAEAEAKAKAEAEAKAKAEAEAKAKAEASLIHSQQGLPNLKNTCYFNSAVQLLRALPIGTSSALDYLNKITVDSYGHYCVKINNKKYRLPKETHIQRQTLDAWKKLLDPNMNCENSEPEIRKILKCFTEEFSIGTQSDPMEAITKMFVNIFIPNADLFKQTGGNFSHDCLEAGYTVCSVKKQPSNSVFSWRKVPFQSLEWGFNLNANERIADSTPIIHKRTATTQTLLLKNVKRALFNKEKGEYKDKTPQPVDMESVQAIIFHHGTTPLGGHYTSLRKIDNGLFLYIDDDRVCQFNRSQAEKFIKENSVDIAVIVQNDNAADYSGFQNDDTNTIPNATNARKDNLSAQKTQ